MSTTPVVIPPASQGGDTTPDAVRLAQQIVDELYEFRDRYYESHPITDDRKTDVLHKQEDVMRRLQELNFSPKDKCFQMLYQGRVLNVSDDYNADAEAYLSKAIKLNPKLAEAWCELGECHWKHGEVTKAYDALRSALDYKVDQRALRCLSMVLRSLPAASPEERGKNVQLSWQKARDALNLNLTDGLSWMNMANALMSVFFMGAQRHRTSTGQTNASHMAKALAAFEQAAKDPIAKADPSLYFNWGVALWYEDEFARALSNFRLAIQLDPSWDKPREYAQDLMTFVRNCHVLMQQKGQMKAKRLQNLIQQLTTRQEKELGPYGGGQYTSGTTSGSSTPLEYVTFNQLQVGFNLGKVTLGTVLATMGSSRNTSFTVLLVDREGSLRPVSFFCIGTGQGPAVEDTVAIPDPYVENVDLQLPPGGQIDAEPCETVQFNLIRVPTTEILVVNGKRINSKWAARPVLETEILST